MAAMDAILEYTCQCRHEELLVVVGLLSTENSTGNSSGMIQACPGAGPYSSSRPAGETWLSVGEAAAKSIAVWIVGLQKKRSLSGVVTGFEVVNEPGLGFTGMVDPIRRYHDNVVPAVQKIFKDASLAVSTTDSP